MEIGQMRGSWNSRENGEMENKIKAELTFLELFYLGLKH